MKCFSDDDLVFLRGKANDIRKDIIQMTNIAKAGHPGGSLSAVEIVTALYFHAMNIDPQNPGWEDRDRFILSKGHACPVMYAALAEKGYFGLEHLKTLRKFQSILQGHPDMQKTPGVDISAGSLGNGLSVGVGMALAARWKMTDYKVFVVLGDGELQEGMVWEAAMAAAHFDLSNLVAFVDYNGIQINGWVNDVMAINPLADKWRAFGWIAHEVDGHDLHALQSVLGAVPDGSGRPVAVIAHTVKGKGISFMEDDNNWHYRVPTADEVRTAREELGLP